jgi:hypothetical protein
VDGGIGGALLRQAAVQRIGRLDIAAGEAQVGQQGAGAEGRDGIDAYATRVARDRGQRDGLRMVRAHLALDDGERHPVHAGDRAFGARTVSQRRQQGREARGVGRPEHQQVRDGPAFGIERGVSSRGVEESVERQPLSAQR